MKLGARNMLKGGIVDVKKGATTAHVRIDIGGKTIAAAITNEAVDELKLAVGRDAYAVVKASDGHDRGRLRRRRGGSPGRRRATPPQAVEPCGKGRRSWMARPEAPDHAPTNAGVGQSNSPRRRESPSRRQRLPGPAQVNSIDRP